MYVPYDHVKTAQEMDVSVKNSDLVTRASSVGKYLCTVIFIAEVNQ